MKIVFIALIVAMTFVGDATAQTTPATGKSVSTDEKQGNVCVLPNPAERPERVSPGGEYNPATLTVNIDKRQPIHWPHKQAVTIENVDLKGRHLLVLTSDGKRIQSLYFRFSEYKDTTLCLSFDGYQGVQLADKYSALWCKVALRHGSCR